MEFVTKNPSLDSIPAQGQRVLVSASERFWERWHVIQVVATARFRTALIKVIRKYERDCLTPQIREFGSDEETTICPWAYHHVVLRSEAFACIPGIFPDRKWLEAAFERAAACVDAFPRKFPQGSFARASALADFYIASGAYSSVIPLLEDWYSAAQRRERRYLIESKDVTHANYTHMLFSKRRNLCAEG